LFAAKPVASEAENGLLAFSDMGMLHCSLTTMPTERLPAPTAALTTFTLTTHHCIML
jgi:hypothetical protein